MTFHPQHPDPLHQADRDTFTRGVHHPDACTLAELPAPDGAAWTIRYDDYAPTTAFLWTPTGGEPLCTITRHDDRRWIAERAGRVYFGPDPLSAMQAALP